MGDLPALVFFNACEAARVSASRRRPRAASAAGGPALGQRRRGVPRRGVANFIGTHWPVGDEAALAFSTRLYPALLSGRTLGDSIREARRAVQSSGSGDWANYVHYGNTAFVLAPALR